MGPTTYWDDSHSLLCMTVNHSFTAWTSRFTRLAEGLFGPVRSAFLFTFLAISIARRYLTTTDSRSPGTDQVRTK